MHSPIHADTTLSDVICLQAYVRDLIDDIGDMVEYVQQPIHDTLLPLGVIGDILACQLIREGVIVEDQTKTLIVAQSDASEFEQARLAAVLHKKLAMIETLIGLIMQLPASDANAWASARTLSRQVLKDCQKMTRALTGISAKALVSVH